MNKVKEKEEEFRIILNEIYFINKDFTSKYDNTKIYLLDNTYNLSEVNINDILNGLKLYKIISNYSQINYTNKELKSYNINLPELINIKYFCLNHFINYKSYNSSTINYKFSFINDLLLIIQL